MPSARPSGTIVRVAADWLVVSAATAKIAIAIMNGKFSAMLPRSWTIASSLFAMKVSAIQAIPNSAIIATIPDLKIGELATSFAFTLQSRRISAAAVSMNIWMSGVIDIGSTPPSSAATVGRSALEEAEDADRGDAGEEDGDAALGERRQDDVGRRRGRADLARREAPLVLGVVVEVLPVAAHDERHREDADDAGGDGDEQDVDQVVAVHLDERQERGRRRGHRARGDPERGCDRRAGQRALRADLVRVRDLVDHRDDREEGVARAGEDREDVRDVRGDEVERLRPGAERRARDLDHVVDAACCLHRRRRRDDGDDDEHRADRRLPRLEPEEEDEDERADAAPEAEADSARADAEEDEDDDDEALDARPGTSRSVDI